MYVCMPFYRGFYYTTIQCAIYFHFHYQIAQHNFRFAEKIVLSTQLSRSGLYKGRRNARNFFSLARSVDVSTRVTSFVLARWLLLRLVVGSSFVS